MKPQSAHRYNTQCIAPCCV
ncbi:hypothetical protein GJAV_G00016860 [Gymnothorax javanicus]|nr:hypothetical protein GJAV_G00016860 [Gymnothorax javanicus]